MSTHAESPAHIRWLSNVPELRSPILITAFEGWNDAGDAASIAARHLADRWDGSSLAEIDAEFFYDFSTTRPLVQLDDDRQRSLTWPTNMFRSCRISGATRDAIVLTGLEPQLRWRTFCEQVIATAEAVGVGQVITLGALLADVPHSRPVEVYGATDDEELMSELDLEPSSYEGPTGIVGVLSSMCREAGIPTASVWATVPSYVPGAPSPKAGLALVERVCDVIGTSVYCTDLEIAAATYERQVDELVSEDDDTAGYVADLEEAWDDADENGDEEEVDEELDDDPETLLAEVEQFLRDNE
ncbi:MAG: PAC2 family protein [Acidimicrobiales bacterium]|nr:PAC2 family protein [Acidimicrobiales bacterium]